jgi:hypothetical protein
MQVVVPQVNALPPPPVQGAPPAKSAPLHTRSMSVGVHMLPVSSTFWARPALVQRYLTPHSMHWSPGVSRVEGG